MRSNNVGIIFRVELAKTLPFCFEINDKHDNNQLAILLFYPGIHVNVWSPPALSHKTADKFVRIDRVLIVGTSPSFDCVNDSVVPRNSAITKPLRAPRSKGSGHIGLMLTTFSSSTSLAPKTPWHSVESYPAIRGVVKLNNVGFAHFGTKCGHDSVALTTNPMSPDAFHPVETKGISLYNVDNDKLFYIAPSNIGWINPSDCIDMDCDGAKHVLIKDLDGTLTGASGGSVISKAEYEWNGDPRRGLGIRLVQRLSCLPWETAQTQQFTQL